MNAKAAIRLRFPSEKRAETVYVALKPETNKSATMRSKAVVKRKGSILTLEVKADDTVALRAALNAYLRWASSVIDILDFLEPR